VIFLCYLSYHTHRGEEPFDTHVWILKTLLERTGNSEDDMDAFHHYIIAACFPKMNSRMTDKFISTTYYDCLLNLKTFSFIPPKELGPDCKNCDGSFIRAIPLLSELADTKIPFLSEFAKTRDPNEIHQLSEIYDRNTCIEFHLLLCELLSKFKNSLNSVERKRKKKNGESQDVLKALRKVRIVGYYLRTMVRSSVMEAHLQSISSRLDFDTTKSWTPGPEDSEDTDIAEFQRLKPFSMRRGRVVLLWESYRDWLMLLVHYFDAAEELALYVKSYGRNLKISISILSPPKSDKLTLSWTDLLEDEHLFPTVLGQPSGKEFIDFLKKRPQVIKEDVKNLSEVTKSTLLLKGELESISPAQLDNKINELTGKLKNITSLDFDELCTEFLALKQSKAPRAQIQTIEGMLSVLYRQADFYQQLFEGPIQTGQNPRGTYHCEAYIASLLAFWDGNSGELVGDFEELNTTHDIGRIGELVKKFKASHVFMHHLNLY
jgi:hypothetical protein